MESRIRELESEMDAESRRFADAQKNMRKSERRVKELVFAQEEDFLHQLIWGVRFLDVRAGFYPTTPERFWLVHGIIKTHPMAEGIEDVKTFLRNTQEIIIWEVNGYEQVWDDEAHAEFKEFLIGEFSDWLGRDGFTLVFF